MDETEVVFRAINNNMLAKVVKNDLPLFKNIMKDIFPTMNIEIMNKNDRLVPLIE